MHSVALAVYTTNRLVFISEVEIVYRAVRTVSLYNTDMFRPYMVDISFAVDAFGHMNACAFSRNQV